jgi:hypothetical protein
MAVMSAGERAAACATFMQNKSNLRELLAGVTKADIRAAIDAVDQWADDNTSSFNTAIPLPARTALTTQQKAEILLIVIRRRTQGN